MGDGGGREWPGEVRANAAWLVVCQGIVDIIVDILDGVKVTEMIHCDEHRAGYRIWDLRLMVCTTHLFTVICFGT